MDTFHRMNLGIAKGASSRRKPGSSAYLKFLDSGSHRNDGGENSRRPR
jgi:hypothetical protein